jgi:hypothetical protein
MPEFIIYQRIFSQSLRWKLLVGSTSRPLYVPIWWQTGRAQEPVWSYNKFLYNLRYKTDLTGTYPISFFHYIVARMWRLYKTGIGLTNGFIGSHTVTHNYSVYTLHSQFTIVLAESSYCVFTGFLSSNTAGSVRLQL